MMIRNLVTSLFLYERIQTTDTKAKIVNAIAEKILNRAKKSDLNSKRFVYAYLCDKKAGKKLYEVLLPRVNDKKSGFIHTIKVGNRLGDGAPVSIVQFTDYKPIVKPKETAVDEEVKPEATKKERKIAQKIEKLSQTEKKGNVITEVRKKGERRISNAK